MSLYHYRRSENSMTSAYDSAYFERFKALYNFFSKSDIASSPYAKQLDYYYSYLIKMSVSNVLKPHSSLTFREKLGSIREICGFMRREGFADDLDISEFHHRLYFNLLKRSKPLLLVICIYITKFVQRLCGRRK